MIWRSGAIAALALLACADAAAQAPAFSPAVTRHTLKLDRQTLSYTAEAGLMPIRSADGSVLIADMSYVAYTAPPNAGETRPVAFIWNGGSGANTTPLHYGAFGPRRLVVAPADARAQGKAADTLKPNAGALLDVADLVFIDQIETGFGRYAPGVAHRPHLNQVQDARAFGTFIESYLGEHGGAARPTIIVGESYGVRRAQLVTEDLLKRGIEPEALVLISGYSLVGKRLDPVADGAFRMPGYAALAFARGQRSSGLKTENDAHEAALVWARGLLEKVRAGTPGAGAELIAGFKRFFGFSELEIENRLAFRDGQDPETFLRSVSTRHAPIWFSDIETTIAYDTRKPETDGREWVSQAIVDDLRKDLGFNPPARKYYGQEYDPGAMWLPTLGGSQPMKIHRADGTVVEFTPETADQFPELQDAIRLMTNLSGVGLKPTGDGLAYSIVNMQAHFGVALSLSRSPMPALMDAAPKLKLFVIGGIYDDLVPCAVGAEIARLDLAEDIDRVRTGCYPGGHMMYEDEKVAARLSADVRAFIREASAVGDVTP